MTTLQRPKTIGVMGSGKAPWPELAVPLGRALALAGYHLLTGGGQGVMTSVSEAFCGVPQRVGRSIGVVPTQADDDGIFRALPGYPNAFVEVPILSPLPPPSARCTAGHVLAQSHQCALQRRYRRPARQSRHAQ